MSSIDGAKKAAAIILSLGAEQAAKVYKYLREEEIEKLTIQVAQLEKIAPDEVEKILSEFYELCLTQKVITEGGMEYAKNILEKAFGAQSALELIERVTRTLSTRAFEFLRKVDPKNLIAIIHNEHPQTIALILSYVSPTQASALLAELPREKQIDVTMRIANMDRASPEFIKSIERVLEEKFSSIVSYEYTEIGGVNYMAEIMNLVDRSTEKFILDELNKVEPILAEEIRRRMFVFEDIITMDNQSIQKFLHEVDTKDLVIALKGATQEVSKCIFANLSVRMQETIKEELEFLHNVRVRDVEEAQQKMVFVIRSLEETGDIVISKGRKDELIV